MNKYLLNFLIAVPLLTGAMAGFNWWIDPYGIYQHGESPAKQSQPVMSERVFKTVGLARTPADVVLLGTSVTDLGIGSEQDAFKGKRVLNLASFGQPIIESRQLMEIALGQSKPQTIVLGLDLLAFNELLAHPSDYVAENYSPLRRYNLLLSVSTLADSWHVLHHPVLVAGQCCDAQGFRVPQAASSWAGAFHRNFVANESVYLREKYLPYPECKFSFDSASKAAGSSFDELRAMIRLAHQQHVDFRLFISPSHARQWETLAAAGLSDTWEAWKGELVRINEEEAKRAAAQPFALWDFSGYDTISSEAVPAADDQKTLMRWYSDSAHYTPALGKLIIQRIFTATNTDLPEGWGVLLNATNLESHLIELRAAQQRYRQTHAQDIAEIAATALSVNQVKNCPHSPVGK